MALRWDRRVGGPPDGGVHHDGVLERFPGHDVGGSQVLAHHLDDAQAGAVRHLGPLPVRRGDGGRSGKLHAQRLGQRVHGGGGAHGRAVARRRRRRGHQVDEAGVVDLACGVELAGLPHDGARAGAAALVPAVEHGAHRQCDGRQVHGGRGHQARRGGLVAADGEHHPVERVALQHLYEPQVGQVAIERGGGPLAGLLDGVHAELERDPAGLVDALAHPLGQLQVVPVAWRQVRAGLGDPDLGLVGLQLLTGQPVVEVAFEVQRRQVRVALDVEPGR